MLEPGSTNLEPNQIVQRLSGGLSCKVLLPVTQGDYASKLYLPQNAANSLLGAASAVLALNSHLKHTADHASLGALQEELIREIQAFELQAHELGYTTETIVLARYALCALLDETISCTSWGLLWSKQHTLLMHFHGEPDANERFFTVLQRLCQAPERSVDLLELLYCCLSQGYEGQFRYERGSQPQLERWLEQVYQRITQVRTEVPLWCAPKKATVRDKTPSAMTLPKLFLTASLLLCMIYGAFQYLLQVTAEPIQPMLVRIQNHANIQSTV